MPDSMWPDGLRVIGVVLTSEDEVIRQWKDALVTLYTSVLRSLSPKGVRSGLLAADLDQQLVYEVLVGPLVMSETLAGESSPDWADRMVSLPRPTITA